MGNNIRDRKCNSFCEAIYNEGFVGEPFVRTRGVKAVFRLGCALVPRF